MAEDLSAVAHRYLRGSNRADDDRLAAEALAGRDSYCKRYLQAYRAKKLESL